MLLQCSFQIHHILQLYAAVYDDVVVIIDKEILDHMAAGEAAFFIKGDGGGAVAGADLQGVVLPAVGICHVVDQLPVSGLVHQRPKRSENCF